MKIKVRVKKQGNKNITTAKFDKTAKNITVVKNKNTNGSKIKKIQISSSVPISKVNNVDIRKFLGNLFA